MVLPIKDVPTAPAQGALAVEISASNTVVRARLEEISHRPTWDAVCREREVLARHGGGCHQALGATILPRSYGTITSVRARSADGCVTTWSLASQDAGPPRTSARYIWPRPDERGHAQRTSLDVPPPAGTPDLWISRSEALPEHWTISPEQLVWAAGGTTWRRLAARGVWVNGCADGLGDDEDPGVNAMAGRVPRWRRLTHADAVRNARCAVRGAQSEVDEAIATYAVQTVAARGPSAANALFLDQWLALPRRARAVAGDRRPLACERSGAHITGHPGSARRRAFQPAPTKRRTARSRASFSTTTNG